MSMLRAVADSRLVLGSELSTQHSALSTLLLVHGLGRTPLSLFGLAAALRRAGHRTRFFGYSPTLEPLPRIVRRLADRLRELGEPIGLVGHSLGGLLLRMALVEVPHVRVHRLVMLGTPNHPPTAARLASRFLPFRLYARGCGRFLADPTAIARLPPPVCRVTLIAGTAGPRANWLPLGDTPNDGLVAVSEVAIPGTDHAPILAPAWHTFMMDHPRVRSAVLAAMMIPGDRTRAQGGG